MNISPLVLQAFAGFFFLIIVAFLFSENKKQINWRLIIVAFIIQNIIYLLINHVPAVAYMVSKLASGVVKLLEFAHDGAKFVFGDIADMNKYGFIFLIVVVPTIIFFGAFIAILYFFGIIQKIIAVLAFILRKTVKLSGAESLVVIADIFLGQNEGPLVIGPYVKTMTRSELALAFIAGLANIAGSTMGMYLTFIAGNDSQQMVVFANYLLTASLMNALSAIIFAKIIFPETQFEQISTTKVDIHNNIPSNFVESVINGAMTGMKISVAVITILVAVIPLIHFLDFILLGLGNLLNLNTIIHNSTQGSFQGLSLEYIFGQIFRIFAFFMGISWSQTINVGSLLGQKVVINEFVAYMSLGQMKIQHLIDQHSLYVSTFALCSFSNFSSIGISLGSYSILAPGRQHELAEMAFKALFAAVLAGFMTATVASFWHTLL